MRCVPMLLLLLLVLATPARAEWVLEDPGTVVALPGSSTDTVFIISYPDRISAYGLMIGGTFSSSSGQADGGSSKTMMYVWKRTGLFDSDEGHISVHVKGSIGGRYMVHETPASFSVFAKFAVDCDSLDTPFVLELEDSGAFPDGGTAQASVKFGPASATVPTSAPGLGGGNYFPLKKGEAQGSACRKELAIKLESAGNASLWAGKGLFSAGHVSLKVHGDDKILVTPGKSCGKFDDGEGRPAIPN